MRVVHVNADPGVRPGGEKGAAVHVTAVREAFARLGAAVVALDEPVAARLRERLDACLPAGVDLVYERYALNAYEAGEWARRHGVPHVLEVNAPLDEEARRHRPQIFEPVDRADRRRLMRGAARVLAVSGPVAAAVQGWGASPGRVVVVPNAVDPERFHPARRAEVRGRSVPEDRFVLGFHGRLRPWHGFERLVAAAGRLADGGRPVHVLTVGRGPFAAELGRRLPAGAFTCVEWVSHEAVGGWVAAFDALPLTYPPEEAAYFSPLKLAEAMASGVVPVVPDLGDLTRAVEHDVNGLVYPAGDVGALTAALARLADEPALRAALGAAARERAAAHTWTGVARELLASLAEGVS